MTDSHVAPVQAVQHTSNGRGRGERTNLTCANAPVNQSTKRTCYRCGADAHLANAANCPAATATCRQYKKTGNFSKVCRSTQPHTDVREVELPEVLALYTDHAASGTTKITCTVEITAHHSQPCTVDLVVDTGSSVSILPQSLYVRHFNHVQLTQSKVRLVSYSKTHIPVLGCLSANVSLHGRTAPCTFYIVNNGTPLLGRDIMTALQLCTAHNRILPPDASTSPAPVLECAATPTPDGSIAPANWDDSDPEYVALLTTARHTLSATDLDSACATCPELTKLRAQITRGWPPSPKGLDPDLLLYYKLRLELSVKELFIFRGSRLIVPIALRPDLIAIAHESHHGVVRIKQQLCKLYWWPKMDAEVLSAIRSCQLCQLNDKTVKPRPDPLQPVPLPDGPWQEVSVDIVGPFDIAPPECRYAITLTDYYSKWPEVAFTHTITTEAVITFLSTVFSRHGNPLSIVTDNGVQFTSAAFAAFLQERQIRHHRSSLYYPAANGQIERFNRVLKQTVQLAIQQQQPWKPAVTDFLHVYRATPHATTGTSPFQLLHGRPMRTKLTLLPPASTPPAPTLTDMDIRHRVSQRQHKMKTYTDARRGARPPAFQKGDRVRVRNPLHVPKGHRKFSDPLTISKKLGEGTYRLSNGNTWNASHLPDFPTTTHTPTHEDTNPPDETPEPRPLRDTRQPTWLKDFVT